MFRLFRNKKENPTPSSNVQREKGQVSHGEPPSSGIDGAQTSASGRANVAAIKGLMNTPDDPNDKNTVQSDVVASLTHEVEHQRTPDNETCHFGNDQRGTVGASPGENDTTSEGFTSTSTNVQPTSGSENDQSGAGGKESTSLNEGLANPSNVSGDILSVVPGSGSTISVIDGGENIRGEGTSTSHSGDPLEEEQAHLPPGNGGNEPDANREEKPPLKKQDTMPLNIPAEHSISVSEEERTKQQALKEQTAYVGGGKKGFLDKLGWPKRQEKGNDNILDSTQKRLWRFGGPAKAVSLDIDDLSDDQVIIAVMGPTGAGKSSFIAKVTGGDVRIGHDLQSCTTDIKIVKYECPERSDFDVVFVDTPGFDDTERSDVEILEMIADWLNKTYERKIILAGILYFHRISDNRMAGTPLKNLKMFRELCGKNALQNIILTTTMWDEVDAETGARREAELRSKYWKAMIDHGSATARFHSTQESAWDIVDHFVRDSNARHAVLLQNEMSEMKKQLPETNAGQKLYTELEVLVHKQQATLKKIREETKQHADPVILDALKAEYAGLRTQLATVVNDMESMKLPLGKRILRLIWGPMFGAK